MSDPNELVVVWEITPDPNGAFDYLIVGNETAAGEAAAKAALMSWDAGEVAGQPGDKITVQCYQMRRADLEALPEP